MRQLFCTYRGIKTVPLNIFQIGNYTVDNFIHVFLNRAVLIWTPHKLEIDFVKVAPAYSSIQKFMWYAVQRRKKITNLNKIRWLLSKQPAHFKEQNRLILRRRYGSHIEKPYKMDDI